MNMRKAVVFFLSVLLIVGCSPSKKELFKDTDHFVESLETTYKSYGILSGSDHQKLTEDGLYQITPIGRMVNVKIMKVVSREEYEDLRDDLESHYKNDSRVNSVYINNGGTIMIDCRN